MDKQKKEKKRGGRPPGGLFSFTAIRVKPETQAALEILAEKDGRSISGYIRRVLEKHIDEIQQTAS